ncbi:MAG: nuclear transport factor 2 family protein [Solirubrobacterales bacterium]|nr:nuclear transport factor 2 family protein [Solirubrobacterales bacterium]
MADAAPAGISASAHVRDRDRSPNLAEVHEVETVLTTERWARDMARWDVMLEQYHPDSLVDISWIRTSGPEFVRLSRESFDRGSRSAHVLSPPLIHVNGTRATADTGSIIVGRLSVGGVSAFLTSFGRIVERIEKRRDTWRIAQLEVIYQFDYLTADNPADTLPVETQRWTRYRPSYRALSYWVEETQGSGAVRYDLPGVDRPETIDALYNANNAWLAAAAAPDRATRTTSGWPSSTPQS